jgi:hypothetical protein
MGVQTAYTEQGVSAIVQAKKDAGKSLRAIASEYGKPVNHADIERILQGRFPHDHAKRKALGLPPICVACGQKVHRVRVMPGWVNQAADFLAAHEDSRKNKRIYARGGRRAF